MIGRECGYELVASGTHAGVAVSNVGKTSIAIFGKLNLQPTGFRLGAPSNSSSKKIALIKLLLRLRSQVRIGVRAAGKTKPNEQPGRGSAPEKPSTSITKLMN
jgi:hypothetical protein